MFRFTFVTLNTLRDARKLQKGGISRWKTQGLPAQSYDRQMMENRVKYRANICEKVMKRLKDIYQKITGVTSGFNEDHVGAYAAQSAYFFMLCMIPIILLLITMVQYTPVTKADVMTAVIQVFPS